MRMAPTWTADVIGCVSNRIVQEERRVRSKQSVSLAFNRWSKKGKLQMGWLSSENLKERESTRSRLTLVLCEDIVNRIGSARAPRCREFRGDYGWRGSAGLWGAPGAKAPLARLSATAPEVPLFHGAVHGFRFAQNDEVTTLRSKLVAGERMRSRHDE